MRSGVTLGNDIFGFKPAPAQCLVDLDPSGLDHVLGFGVNGGATKGCFRPAFQGKADRLTGGAFGLEASVFGAVAVMIGIALLCKWKGSPLPRMSETPISPLRPQ
ncbi:MAG: hypothetical protein Q8O00_15820 [Holophaga sp.]|nr:hypothetical protein [Holophaga sp.]